MPKISVHLEADSAEEFQALLSAFHVKPPVPVQPAEEDPVFASDAARAEREAAPVPVGQAETVPGQAETVPGQAETVPGQSTVPAETPKTRKPRGPNKPKMLPVDETPQSPVSPQSVAAVEEPLPVKAPEPQAPVVSRQDLLDAFAEYVQRYGASFGYTDVSKLLQTTFGDGVRKASDVTDANIPVAIGAIRTALADNPYNRKRDYA